MSRIVFFINDFNTKGGTERVASIIASSLADRGHDICILGLNGSPSDFYYDLHSGIQRKSLRILKANAAVKIWRAQKAIRKFNQEHGTTTFITVESMLSLFSVPALLRSGIKHIVWEHFNFHVNLGLRARDFARQLSLLSASQIVVLTEKDVTFWKHGAWIRNAKVQCIPNPVTIANNQTTNSGKKNIIAVGRLTFQKGFDLLISAWSILASRLEKGWTLQIIGDGPDLNALTQQIVDLNLQDSIDLIPATKGVHRYFEQASVYCLSSRFEGLPMVLLEALAYKLPIVAFDCDTGPAQVITHRHNGLLVEPNNITALADSLFEVIKKPELRSAMSDNSQGAYEQFRLEKIIPKWEELLF